MSRSTAVASRSRSRSRSPERGAGAGVLNQAGRSGELHGASQSIEFRAGDWQCRACGRHVYGSRTECKCGQPKALNAEPAAQGPFAAAATAGSRPGDWPCPSCGAIVYASKALPPPYTTYHPYHTIYHLPPPPSTYHHLPPPISTYHHLPPTYHPLPTHLPHLPPPPTPFHHLPHLPPPPTGGLLPMPDPKADGRRAVRRLDARPARGVRLRSTERPAEEPGAPRASNRLGMRLATEHTDVLAADPWPWHQP